MTYSPTPLNITAGLMILFGIYSFIKDSSLGPGDGLVNFWAISLIIAAILFLLVDFALLNFVKKQSTLMIIEVVIIIGFIFTMVYVTKN